MTMTSSTPQLTVESVREHCVSFLSGLLDIEPSRINTSADFDRIGLDSSMAVAMIFDLETWSGMELSPSLLFEFPSIDALASHVAGVAEARIATNVSAKPALA